MYEFAERYENVTDVVFGELDQADNEPEGRKYQKLPHLMYHAKGDNKTAIEFNRTFEGGDSVFHIARWCYRLS